MEPTLSLLDDLRFERPLPISGDFNRDVLGRVGQHRLRPSAVADIR